MRNQRLTQKLRRGLLATLLLTAMLYSAAALSSSTVRAQEEDCSGGDPGFCPTGWVYIGSQTDYFGECHTNSDNYECGCSSYHTNCVTSSTCNPQPDLECHAG